MFSRASGVACILLIGAVAFQPAAAQGIIFQCGKPDGKWSWSTGGVVTFEPTGRAYWAPDAEAAPVLEAQWACDENTGMIVVTWSQGVIDTLTLSPDGELKGSNQHDVAVSGVRYQAPRAAAPAGPVPPGLIGTWVLEIQLPTPQGPVTVTWRIAADGSYEMDAGPFSHSGNMTAFGGEWALEAESNDFTDGGKYRFQNWATIITEARSGVGRWHRRDPSLRLEMVELNAQQIPTGLPDLVAAARLVAGQWRPDAILVSLEFERNDAPNPAIQDSVDLGFMSPATGGGLVIRVEPEGAGFFEHGVVRWAENEIPDGFLDLPAVWAIARQYGLLPPLDRADLRIWEPPDGDPVLAWSLAAARGDERGINIDAAAGGRLEGDLTGYVAAYNAQWEAAIAGLRRLFAARRSPSGSSDSDWSTGSTSSSYSDDDTSSGSSWDTDTGLQNAWGAGDMDAYNRIQSGTATGEDCARYGC